MPDAARILIDVHERRSGIAEHLTAHGAVVEVRPLPAGDYLLPGGIVVERKEVLDLHSAIVRRRLWRQLEQLRARDGVPFLVVEGRSIDDGPLSPDAIRGACIAAMGMGIRLLQTRDPRDTARWVYRIAVRATRGHRGATTTYVRATSAREAPSEAMLAAVPGISASIARRLLEEFGSVTNVLAHSEQDWRRVPGVGARRAAALAQAISDDHVATHLRPIGSSRLRREEQGPST